MNWIQISWLGKIQDRYLLLHRFLFNHFSFLLILAIAETQFKRALLLLSQMLSVQKLIRTLSELTEDKRIDIILLCIIEDIEDFKRGTHGGGYCRPSTLKFEGRGFSVRFPIMGGRTGTLPKILLCPSVKLYCKRLYKASDKGNFFYRIFIPTLQFNCE